MAILSTLIAAGQQPATHKTMEDDPAFRTSVEKSFREYENSLSTHCEQVAPDWSRARKTFYAKPAFDAQGKLVSALWSESVPGLACGEARNFRAMVSAHDGRMNFFPVTPGTSNAGPRLTLDARLPVSAALLVRYPHETLPDTFDILDTELIGTNPPPPHQSWKEIWLIRCGKRTARVPIMFIPDETGPGTNFSVQASSIVDVPSPDGGVPPQPRPQ